MTLNQKYMSQVDFNSVRYCTGAGTSGVQLCKGSGVANNYMVFVAAPSVIENALNGLHYSSIARNIHDTITVTLYDGNVSTYKCNLIGRIYVL